MKNLNTKQKFKDTPAGRIPVDWEVAKLSDIVDFYSGGTPSRSNPEYWGGDIPWVSAKDLKAFVLDGSIENLTEAGAENGTRLMPVDTLFILVRGMTLNHTVPVGVSVRTMAFNQDVKAMRVSAGVFPNFLGYYLVQSGSKLLTFVDQAGHGTGRLPSELLYSYMVAIPPIDEQKKIAEILSEWDQAIRLQEELIREKEERKRGLMQQLLTGKRRLAGFEGEWKTYQVGDVVKERMETGRGDLPLLSITADRGVVNRDEVDKHDTSNPDKYRYKRIAPGDIGYNTMRLWQGVAALSGLEGIISPAYTVVIPGPKVDAEFVEQYFKLPENIHLFFRYSQGLVDDTLNCKFKHFRLIHMPFPEVKEQKAIAKILRECDREIAGENSRLNELKTQKKGLMQKLLTGQVRVGV